MDARDRGDVELAGLHGVTLAQAAEGALVQLARARSGEGGSATARPAVSAPAAGCGLAGWPAAIRRSSASFVRDGALADWSPRSSCSTGFAAGHVPGFPPPDALRVELLEVIAPELLATAVDGWSGARLVAPDAAALATLVRRVDDGTSGAGSRLGWALGVIAREGSPLMQGAAGAVQVLLGTRSSVGRCSAPGSMPRRPRGSPGAAARFRGARAPGVAVPRGAPAAISTGSATASTR